jgi:hypothetical protein
VASGAGADCAPWIVNSNLQSCVCEATTVCVTRSRSTKRGRGQLWRLRRCGGHDDAVAGDDCDQEVFEEGSTTTSAFAPDGDAAGQLLPNASGTGPASSPTKRLHNHNEGARQLLGLLACLIFWPRTATRSRSRPRGPRSLLPAQKFWYTIGRAAKKNFLRSQILLRTTSKSHWTSTLRVLPVCY